MSASIGFLMVANLRAAADEHKARCHNPECDVSLLMLKRTAQRIADSLMPLEQRECSKFLEGWPL